MRTIDADDFGNRMYHEVFEKDTDMQKWDSGCWVRYKLFENVLREQPTIEPERKKGKWIEDDEGYFYCDQCGKYPAYQITQSDYCPNCGVDNREGDA